MARTKENEAEWQIHRDELKLLWLDQRWTTKNVRDYMAQKYSFHKSMDQYARQFKQWGFKKNSNEEEWKYVAHSRQKRKRDGKDPGQVWMHGKLVPEPKIRKEISRHVQLTAQYTRASDYDPKTPEGVCVGTPQSEITATVSDDPLNILAMDWCQNPSIDFLNFDTSTMFWPATEDPLAFQFEQPGLHSSGFYLPGSHGAAPFNMGNDASEPCLPGLEFARPTASADRSIQVQHISNSMIDEITKETRLVLSTHLPEWEGDHCGDLTSALEPISLGNVNNDLTRRAAAIFQSPSPENLTHYLSLCIYLISNNLMSSRSIDTLVLLIAKSGSQSSLKALLKSTTTTIEIFMSNLLASAAAMGDSEICRILIEAGADLDAPSGLCIRITPLHRALLNKKTDCVRLLLEAGADPHLTADGQAPLQVACSLCDSSDAVHLLLQFGARVDLPQDCARLSPLQLAVRQGELASVQLLLDSYANPNSFTTSKHGTALQIACSYPSHAEIVDLLITAGADIDSRSGYRCDKRRSGDLADYDTESESDIDFELDVVSDDDLDDSFLSRSRKPAILIAAENDNWEVVQLLLGEGAAVNASLGQCPAKDLEKELDCNFEGYGGLGEFQAVFTPLQAAIRSENIFMTRMLLRAGAHIDARPKGKYGHTPLQICAMVGNERLFEILLQNGADIHAPAGVHLGRTALQAAAIHSDTRILSRLLRNGADPNALPAVTKGRTALQIAVAAGNTEGVRILLDANAAVNSDPSLTEGVTALDEAIQIENPAIRQEMVNILLRAGAYVKSRTNQEQYAPLHAAVKNKDLELTRKLLEKGADPNLGFCARTNLTPLQEASSQGNESVVQLLVDYGADVNGPPHWSKGRTALQAAIEQNHVPVAKMLLAFGANIKAQSANSYGISAIAAVAKRCNQELFQLFLEKEPDIISSDPIAKFQVIELALSNWKCDVPFLDLLLKAGAAADHVPSCASQMSILEIAVQRHNYRMVQRLLSAGANVNHWSETDFSHRSTALQYAVHGRNVEIVLALLERGADIDAPASKSGGKTALQIAVSQNNLVMTKLLVGHGANVNALPSLRRGRTALQEAASLGSVQLTEYLLARGAHVNAPAAHFGGVTALQGAALRGNIRIVMMLLLAGADINGAPAIEQGRNAIEGAAENGRLDTLHFLLNHYPDTEEFEIRRKRAMKLALANGHLAIGRFLLAYRKHT